MPFLPSFEDTVGCVGEWRDARRSGGRADGAEEWRDVRRWAEERRDARRGVSRGRRGAGAQALACIRTQWTRASGRARARARDVRVDARIWTTWVSAKLFFAHPPSEEYYTKNNKSA